MGRKWHLVRADGRDWTKEELEEALPYASAMYVIGMTGKLYFACEYEMDESENPDMVVVCDG